jgi:DNA-binding IclR family transcriptional regulator
VDSVDKALQILAMLRQRPEVRVVDISRELGISRSTAHRLLSTLAFRGFARRDPVSHRYWRGPELVAEGLARLGDEELIAAAHPHLERLSAKLGETVNIAVLEGTHCRFVDGVNGRRVLRTGVRTGTSLPAHATSGGKALLAELPEDRVRALFPRGLQRLTGQTLTDMADLERNLREIRSVGYSVNDGESELGVSAVAAVVRVRGSAVAAVAVSMPSVRMTAEARPAVVKALRRTVVLVERALH